MNQLEQTYSENWKNLGSILLYQNPDFQFKSDVIITELDGCLVQPLSQAKIYNTLNRFSFEIYAEELITKLQKESQDKSIVIISNQINANKLNIDMIKKKVEMITKVLKIPIIGFFALKPNCFMKPHTGLWKLLKSYYIKFGSSHVHRATIVSNEGGMILEKEKKKTNKILRTIGFSDVDRAFAENISLPFKNIDEYLDDCGTLEYTWDTKIIPPGTREIYVEEIKKRKNPNIFQILGQFGTRDVYVIMIMGAPRCGKTKIANSIIEKWRGHSFGEHNAIERLGMDEYTKQRRYKTFAYMIANRISVVLDGDCHSDELRIQYVKFLKGKNIPVLCIEVNCGLEMAKVFNHAHVEEAGNENVVLYKSRDYNIYRSVYKKPTDSENFKYILYTPRIEERPSVMVYRY